MMRTWWTKVSAGDRERRRQVTHADDEQHAVQRVQRLTPAALTEAAVGARALERDGLAVEADDERDEDQDKGLLQPDPGRVDVEAVLDRARARAGARHEPASGLHKEREHVRPHKVLGKRRAADAPHALVGKVEVHGARERHVRERVDPERREEEEELVHEH
jgi:hypothetical protein